MKKRVITGIVMAAIFIPLLIIPELFLLFQILIMALSLVASYELIKMYEHEKKYPMPIKIIIMITTLVVYLSALVEWDPNCTVSEKLKLLNIKVEFLPMLIIDALVLFSCCVFCHEFNGDDVAKALLINIYAGLGFASLTILRYIGVRYIIYLFLITMLTDCFAYFCGRAFGKHKMCPTISPKKTWEGSVGGTLVATIVGVCFGFFYSQIFSGGIFGDAQNGFLSGLLKNTAGLDRVGEFFLILVVTILASIFSQIGDLVASRLKRTYNIKDYGRIFPGHGGVLDRFDSALFTGIFLLSIFTILNDFLPALANFTNELNIFKMMVIR